MRRKFPSFGGEPGAPGGCLRYGSQLHHPLDTFVDSQPENARASRIRKCAKLTEANVERCPAARELQSLNYPIARVGCCRSEKAQREVPVFRWHRFAGQYSW